MRENCLHEMKRMNKCTYREYEKRNIQEKDKKTYTQRENRAYLLTSEIAGDDRDNRNDRNESSDVGYLQGHTR